MGVLMSTSFSGSPPARPPRSQGPFLFGHRGRVGEDPENEVVLMWQASPLGFARFALIKLAEIATLSSQYPHGPIATESAQNRPQNPNGNAWYAG